LSIAGRIESILGRRIFPEKAISTPRLSREGAVERRKGGFLLIGGEGVCRPSNDVSGLRKKGSHSAQEEKSATLSFAKKRRLEEVSSTEGAEERGTSVCL